MAMRQWVNWKMIYGLNKSRTFQFRQRGGWKMRDKKAQSLTELSIFGTILLGVAGYLLTNGLNFNYSEYQNMRTFRQALNKAYAARNSYFSASVLVLDQKPLPELGSPLTISTPSRQFSAASALWSNDLFSSFSPGDFGQRRFLPKFTIMVGEKEYNLTTASWRVESDLSNLREKKEDKDDRYKTNGASGSDGIYWYWKTVTFGEITENNPYDVDGDNKEEMVVFKEASSLKIIDSQDGEIDSTINSADLKNRNDITLYNGFGNEYNQIRKVRPGTSLRKQENNREIITTETIDVEDEFQYRIRLNRITKGDEGVVSQMHEDDLVWIDLDEDKWVDGGETFSRDFLWTMELGGYNGKRQFLELWISQKVNQKTTRIWTTPH